MQELKIKITDDLYDEVKTMKENFFIEVIKSGLKNFKIKTALELYKNNKVTFGKAAQIANIPKDEFAIQARVYGFKPEYDELMLKEELECGL
jgi:predicted HTH domain antitoxin